MRRRSPVQRLALGGMAALALLLAGSYISYRIGLQPAATTGSAQRFEVRAGDRVPEIADHLKAAGLIRGRNSFISYLNFHNLRGHINVGTYSIAPTLSGPEIADMLAHGKTLSDRLVIPEGSRLSDIDKLVTSHGISAAAFQAALSAPHTNAFLADKPATVDLEGYLFPDSYEINSDTTAATLVDTMLKTFGDRVGSEYVQAYAAEGLNLHQGLTVASIVEREVSNSTDRPIVAQIFLKRLKLGMPMGSEVTARYAAGLLGVPFTTTVNSPYNTLTHPGLPPGPICSPGLGSLDAVAHPAGTDYLYFITGRDGHDYFAHTFAEHQANIAKYGLAGQ